MNINDRDENEFNTIVNNEIHTAIRVFEIIIGSKTIGLKLKDIGFGTKVKASKEVTPKQVKITSITNKKKGTMLVKYNELKDATKYEVWISEDKSFKQHRVEESYDWFIVEKLKKGKTYYIKVRACRIFSDKTINGKWSEVKEISIKK